MNKILRINESSESKISYVECNGIYNVRHDHFATDRYESGITVVKASSKQEAMDILNEYLSTNPDGGYTARPCISVKDVYDFEVLAKL